MWDTAIADRYKMYKFISMWACLWCVICLTEQDLCYEFSILAWIWEINVENGKVIKKYVKK